MSMTRLFWLNQNFLKLWIAQTVSRLGDHITFLAFPLTAIVVFKATPSQMGILRALYSASAVLVGLFAGLLIDRFRRRPVLVWADIGFSLLYVSIPVATMLSALHLGHLYVIQFVSGILWFFSDVALRSFLPSLVDRNQLIEANGKLGLTHSFASIVGPGTAGMIVQVLTAPIAMIVDAVSFCVSALFIWRIQDVECDPKAERFPSTAWAEMREGLEIIVRNPILRVLTEALLLQHLFTALISAVFVLYATNSLGLNPFVLGLIFSAYGPGFFIGSIMTGWVTRRYGIGWTIIIAALINALGTAVIPLVGGSAILITLLLMGGHIAIATSLQTSEIGSLSVRQSIAPNRVQGRINGSFRFVALTADLMGAMIIVFVGDAIAIRTLIAIGAAGLFLTFARLLLAPSLRCLRELPTFKEVLITN